MSDEEEIGSRASAQVTPLGRPTVSREEALRVLREHRLVLIERAREVAVELCKERGRCTAQDVRNVMEGRGMLRHQPADARENWLGAVFAHGDLFIQTGEVAYAQSDRIHKRRCPIWRLRTEDDRAVTMPTSAECVAAQQFFAAVMADPAWKAVRGQLTGNAEFVKVMRWLKVGAPRATVKKTAEEKAAARAAETALRPPREKRARAPRRGR